MSPENDIPGQDRRAPRSGRRHEDEVGVQRAEARVNSDRLASLEALAADYARMSRENSMKRISQRISYVIAGLAIFATLGLFVSNQNRIQEQSRNNAEAISRIDTEGVERRDQNCNILESQHLESVRGLRLTYDYLAGLTVAERQQPINRLLIAQLPQTERQARIDQAPEYCDEPGAAAEAKGAEPVGLPEPDPILPERPEALQKFLPKPTPTPTFDLRSPDARDAATATPTPTTQP